MVPDTTMQRGARLANARPRYADPACTQTVREALAEYHEAIPGLLDEGALDGIARELFHNHDVAHVVFGCDTTIRQEALIDTWTLFGSDLGLSAYVRYMQTPEAKQILVDAGFFTLLREAIFALPDLVRVIVRARRMKKRWPWRDHETYLDRPLDQVREELGIAVLG
jgi:ubiquinone biosynthesis protein Coq4